MGPGDEIVELKHLKQIHKGLSFVVCCHNSEATIAGALMHIARQGSQTNYPWEVVVINNASTDRTAQKAEEAWTPIEDVPFRIVEEPRVGLGHARLRGVQEARFEWISFIDDDNWISSDWTEVACRVMTGHSEVGACGSLNSIAEEMNLPWWFERFQKSYAVGPQDDAAGDITFRNGVVCGAGLTIRKSAMEGLYRKGYQPMLVGRQGTKLTASEDYEICLALKLDGWRVWYEPNLKLKHNVPIQRLNWRHLRGMIRGVGYSSPYLDPYQHIFECIRKGKTPEKAAGGHWAGELCKTGGSVIYHLAVMFRRRRLFAVGSFEWVLLERSIWRFFSLLSLNKKYDRIWNDIVTFPWGLNDPLREAY